MTVKLDAAALDSAISGLNDLATAIDFHRNWCTKDSPVALDSLAEGTGLTRVRDWMTDQVANPLQVVRDLARLLDTEGGGTVEFEGSGDIDTLRAMLGTELAEHMADFGDLDTPEDIEDFQTLMTMLDKYKDDTVVSGAFHTELGPEGLAHILDKARALTDPNGQYQANLKNLTGDSNPSYPEASQLAIDFQDGIAALLANSLATGSLWKDFPDSYATDLANYGNGSTAAIIFDYAGRNGDVFARDFLNDAGDALLEREDGLGGMFWSDMGNDIQFGTADMDSMQDPVLQWMEALKHNGAASQDQLLDPERAKYLLDERFYLYEDVEGGAAGDVLAAATIDQAFNTGTMGKNAATISAWAIDHFGGGADPRDGMKDELGGIIATYIADADRVAQSGLTGDAGIYEDGELLPPWLKDQGLPPYGITMNVADLRGVLNDIGDNEVGSSAVADATMRLNAARLQAGIDSQLGDTGDQIVDPILRSAGANAQLTGFMQDNLLSGAIMDAEADAKTRKKMAELFTIPLNLVPTTGTGPVGPFIMGQVKEQIVNGYVGTGVPDEISMSVEKFGEAKNATTLQALQMILESNATHGPDQQLPVGDLTKLWHHTNGHPDPISSLDNISAILADAEGAISNGYSGAVKDEVDGGIADLISHYGHK